MANLRDAAKAYEKLASESHWDTLLTARADVAELGELAKVAQGSKQKNPATGMDKLCAVALEYSKLLDVVMNQSPEYASLAWGIMKLLLLANINHTRLKENVETHLVKIGERSGLINQRIYYNPTEKMVEAVALFYAGFSKFLGKAIRYYAKSKLGGWSDFVLPVSGKVDSYSYYLGSARILLGDKVPEDR